MQKTFENPQAVISYIMGLTYYQYYCPWCKVQEIAELPILFPYRKQIVEVESYLENSQVTENQQELIRFFLEDVITYYAPESFLYYEMLKYQWEKVSDATAQTLVQKMLEKVQAKQAKYQQEAQTALLEYLANWELESWEAYENAPESLKAEVNIANFTLFTGYDLPHLPSQDDTFSDYLTLADLFFTRIFDKETVQFFINLPTVTENPWEKATMPAVIAADKQFLGIFFWMD